MNNTLHCHNKKIYIILLVVISLFLLLGLVPQYSGFCSWLTPPVALFTGLLYALLCGRAYPDFNKKMSKVLLQYSVVGLGFGMNLHESLASGGSGMAFTIVSVFGTLLIGMLIGRKFLGINRNISYLISSGTAICGGSAIAAVGPVIKAKSSEMSVALATIFVLNAIALFVFPVIGRCIGLDEQQFGFWAAIAIHDTSSVVGAGEAYGEEALRIATTIKLTRALWIVPVTLLTSVLFKNKGKNVSVPMFIIFFVLAMVINTYFLALSEWGTMLGNSINLLARKALTVTLFLIGASISTDTLKSVGVRPLIQGVMLWMFISMATLLYICFFV